MIGQRTWMFRLLVLGLTALLVACGSDGDSAGSPGSQPAANEADADAGLAPEIVEVSNWYNTAPLTLAELRGSPVLIVFWSDT